MARQDKRRGGEPYGPDGRGLVTRLRGLAYELGSLARVMKKTYPKTALRHNREVRQIRANIRWVLAARRAIERAGK